jgi:hypothetical protein
MPLPRVDAGSQAEISCTMCGASNHAVVFPAALVADIPARSEIALEGEAACFDHPMKRAVATCRHCGRFVCQLCAVQFGDETWCPSCVAAGAGKPAVLRDRARTLYDSIAFLAPTVSLLLWPFTMVAAPVSLVLSILKWNQPLSLVRRSRWRFVAAVAVSLVEIGGWCWLLIFLVTRNAQRPGLR